MGCKQSTPVDRTLASYCYDDCYDRGTFHTTPDKYLIDNNRPVRKDSPDTTYQSSSTYNTSPSAYIDQMMTAK